MSVIYPHTQPSIFGRIVSGGDVEQWCVALCKRWTSTYLSERERQEGIDAGTTSRPRAYLVAPTLDKMPEDQLPAIVLVSIGLAEAPRKDGSGIFRGRWDMGIAAIVSARQQEESHALAMRYMAALRTLFVQRPSLDGSANGVTWEGETYDQLDYDDMRTLSAGVARFTVEVSDIATAKAGPITPDAPLDDDTEPWPDWATIDSYDVDVQKVDTIPKGGTQ